MLLTLAVLNMIMPAYFIKLLIDDVFSGRNWGMLWLILSGILVVYIARNVLYFVSKYTAVEAGEDVCFVLRNRLFEHLQQKTLQFYRENKVGQISSRVMDDTYLVQTFIQDELPKLVGAAFLFCGLLAVIFAVNWQLALACTIVLPLHLAVFGYFKGRIKRASRQVQEQQAAVQGSLVEKLLGVEVVKGFTGEQRENEFFQRAIDQSRRKQLRSKTFHVTQKIIADLLVGAGTIALLGFGAYQVLYGSMKPGTYFAFFSLVVRLYPTVLELMSGLGKLTRTTVSIDRVFEMLARDQTESVAARPLTCPVRGKLELEGVTFRYGQGPAVLKNVRLEINPGRVFALVGASGAGKSTLANLVPRFLEPTAGRLLVDGRDVKDYDLRHLRQSIAIASQDCFLFNSTILENLRYARPDATMEQVVATAKRSGAHDFITKLPEGYATNLGQNGNNLSRGELQRIGLTRAMLKNPRILILDEAIASLETVSQAQIIPAILELMKGKTTLMITHNAELLQHADVVVQLQDGRIVFEGSPNHLDTTLAASIDIIKPSRSRVKIPERGSKRRLTRKSA